MADDWRTANQKRASDLIANGHTLVTGIIPNSSEYFTYSYTTGLTELHNHPEIFICGLDPEITRKLLNNAHALIKKGQRIRHGDVIEKIAGIPLIACDLDVSNLGEAAEVNRERYGANYEAMQLFWPDKNGHFPWDADCHPAIKKAQFDTLPPATRKLLHVELH